MSELTPRIRELILELCEELLPDDDFIALARGGSKKGRVTRVASQAGVQTYGVPVGTIITLDMKEAAKKGGRLKPGVPIGAPKVPGVLGVGSKMLKPPAPSKPAANDVAGQFNADATKLKATVTHPRTPGAKVYLFSDGTGVMEDARGRRSKRQNLTADDLKAKGWNVQEHSDEEDSSGSATGSSNSNPRRGGAKSNFEAGEETLKLLATSTPKADKKQTDAIAAFELEGVKVNSALRKGDEPGEENLKVIDGLREVLSNSKTTTPVTVYRGMSFSSPEERDNFVTSTLRPGTGFVDKGFSVASANQDQALLHADADNAENPGVILHIAVPEGSRAASINAATGKDDQDQDVLLADGSRFKVDSVSNDVGGRPIAQVTYIDPMLPAHIRAKMEDDPAISEEQKIAARAKRFSWSSQDIELEDSPLFTGGSSVPGGKTPNEDKKPAKPASPIKG